MCPRAILLLQISSLTSGESYWKWLLVDHERHWELPVLDCGFLPQASFLSPVLNVAEACAVIPGVNREQWERQQAGEVVTVRWSGFPSAALTVSGVADLG